MNKYHVVVLTDKEYKALDSIIRNGWGDGDFASYGGQSRNVQLSAMKHFDASQESAKDHIHVLRHQQQRKIEKNIP